ncbi:Basic helix-loop-helix protein A [Hibiscus syriacus]|uniref:Basic helix-loop-helix protein A n=1 Tax=Hibiscus syriacus TaxID=106335 RepID=A0A6A3C204_HIBSY|nr:Basic helix-loop-helix protein A [Hibiscus syriacus]
MAVQHSNRLRNMLQAIVQSVQWTYSIFWKICPREGILVWSDGYYNGAIKTRKTVQPMELTSEEASLKRSQQLRELYESLLAGETNQPVRRPFAALSPEDLTEPEWFYLLCFSFSFPPGVGLPGKAYARRQHEWLTGADEVDSETFSRVILAKTVLCIPVLDGVFELGTTEKVILLVSLENENDNEGFFFMQLIAFQVEEDLELVQHFKTFFTDHNHNPNPPPPKPALSEHSTSNPATDSAEYTRFPSPVLPPMQAPIELMQLETSEDIRLASPDDASNNLDTYFHMILEPNNSGRFVEFDLECLILSFQLGFYNGFFFEYYAVPESLDGLHQEISGNSQAVSQSAGYPTSLIQSAFSKWTIDSDNQQFQVAVEGTSQCLLKYILFTIPYLHSQYRNDNSPKTRDTETGAGFRWGIPPEEHSANHVLVERRRREKLNERFIILRSLVPFVTKMDKASILGDTIEYVKHLRKKIEELETQSKGIEANNEQSRSAYGLNRTSSMKELRSGIMVSESERARSLSQEPGRDKRKMRKTVDSTQHVTREKTVEVSIIESDALLELQCGYREGLLLDIMKMLREKLRIEITTVQSCLNKGVFVAELRAKVKDSVKGKKVSITEVKRAINQILQSL